MRIKKGDTVQIITGKDRGKTGQVLQVYPKRDKILIENLNIYKKHRRPRKQGEKGEIIEFPKPVDASSVLPVCKDCNQGVRIGYSGQGTSKKRVCKKCGKSI